MQLHILSHHHSYSDQAASVLAAGLTKAAVLHATHVHCREVSTGITKNLPAIKEWASAPRTYVFELHRSPKMASLFFTNMLMSCLHVDGLLV